MNQLNKLDAAYLDAVLFPLSRNKGFQLSLPLVEWHSAPLSSFFSVVGPLPYHQARVKLIVGISFIQ